MSQDVWASAEAYEPYVGRWSREVARAFVGALGVAPRSRWVEVGCGTGALTATVLELAEPTELHAYDASAAYLEHARRTVADPRLTLRVADAASLPEPDGWSDAVVSGLVLNFLPDPLAGIREMRRVARPGGIVAAYLWDYAGEMQLMRLFWDAAVELDPGAATLDEGRRFPLCRPDPLREAFVAAGLEEVSIAPIDVETRFRDFDDYWQPFLGGQGPAPGYAAALPEPARVRLRERLRSRLPTGPDGEIPLIARAWAARGRRPHA